MIVIGIGNKIGIGIRIAIGNVRGNWMWVWIEIGMGLISGFRLCFSLALGLGTELGYL